MDWISNLATSIAVFRLVLICCGMWIQLRSISRPGIVQDGQRRCFAIAGIIYLLGLMPQSLLLLLVSSDLVNVMLDSGYLCSAQKFVCIVAVAFHNLIFLNWIFSYIRSIYVNDNKRVFSFLKRKVLLYFMVSYTTVFLFCRRYLTNDEDTKTFYTDLASRTDNSSFSRWAISSSEKPLQVVRLQLLLCESSLANENVLSYMLMSYTFFTLPLFLLCFIWKLKLSKKQFSENELEVQEDEQSCAWWEQEKNIQRLLSALITVWFYFIQPVIFYLHPEHFVDFGVHLLLTICVFIPWTFSEKDSTSLQSWV